MTQRPSPLQVPLGLQISEEIQPIFCDVEVSELDRDLFYLRRQRLPADSEPSDAGKRESREFKVSDELMRVRFSRSVPSCMESFGILMEGLKRLGEQSGRERLYHVPSMLDFFPEQLREEQVQARAGEVVEESIGDLGCDLVYRQKKSENVEATSVPEAAVPTPAEGSTDEAPPAAVATVVKTTSEGVSVAHSPCAYDLSGSMPWCFYSTEGHTPLSPWDVRYHRVHLWSANIDKLGSSRWAVCGPKQVAPAEQPLDGSCAFKNSQQLSLRDDTEFVLLESVEQFPLLMQFHGMSGAILRYWRPRHGEKEIGKEQIELLGSLGHLVKLQESECVPRVYGGSAVKTDQVTMLESSLIRAPIFAHKARHTDFLLVRARNKDSRSFACVLRPIQHLYCMGQAEPLYRVDVPVVPRLHQTLSARVMLECRRFWLRAKQQPGMEFMTKMFLGERKSLLTRYLADALREIHQKPTLSLLNASAITPEEACVVNAMKEGIRRLAERGVERIAAISPMRIRNYVRDIEIFERSMPAASRTPRVAHLCVQLENEMRVSPWNLTNDYWDVMTGKRGALFQFSPLGDPSGGLGQGISYRKILKTEAASAAAALGTISGSASGSLMEIDEIRSKGKKALIKELVKLNVPERVWKTMSRWQLMRQLALLLGVENDSEERLAPWKRKALHSDKILGAWKKQAKALSSCAAQYENNSETVTVSGSSTPAHTPQDSDDDELEAMMLEDLGDMDDEMNKTDHQNQECKNVITRLQIVSTGRGKSTGSPWSKVTYVYGQKNIALYRKWKELEEEPQTGPAPSPLASPGEAMNPTYWQSKVEMSLKVHRRFQRIIRQAAESGRHIPDCKRCGACHLFGHDQSFEGCPMLVRDLEFASTASGGAANKKRKNLEQSPIYE